MDYKQAFLSQLENSYLGVQIQDSKDLFSQDSDSQYSGSKEAPKKSGFINLLQMKSKYFQHIKNLLEKEKLNHSIYTKLYNFFSSYLNETGTPFFYDTPMHKNIYAKVYTNSKDTSLFYKTQNLYYVKSDTLYHDAEITSQDFKYTFIFDISHFIPNADNAKNKAIFKFTIEENIRIYVLNDKESLKELPNVFKQNSSDLSDEFIKSLKDKKIQLQEEEIKKILSSYKRQNEIDFFIHKNARAFLQEQFNLWLCNYVLDDITQWRQEKIEELNTLKKVAFKIIDFIADFEDELKAIWCKPKFAKNVEYVFSLDRIDSALLDSIINDEGFKAQIKEWQELRLIDESFDIKNINDEKYKFLPLDTKHFNKTTKYKILSSFKDIESTLNGELIKSDNFQDLNTLLPKYQNKVDLIYIDPPYNAPASEIIYKNNFKDSTWLAMMANRLDLAKGFLSERGLINIAIDDIELFNLGCLCDEVFGVDNHILTNSVLCNPQGRVANNISKTSEYNLLYCKSDNTSFNIEIPKINKQKNDTALIRTGTNSRREERPFRYFPILEKDNKLFMITDEEYKQIYNKNTKKFNDDFIEQLEIKYKQQGFNFILPKSRTHELLVWQREFNRVKQELHSYIFKNGKIYTPYLEKAKPTTLWTDNLFSNPEYGTELLKNILNIDVSQNTPKSIYVVQQFLEMTSQDSTILDFFGGSGTTAHAVLELNREGSNRKFVLVEMGEHFYNVIIPRIKKVAFSSEWKNGELKNAKQVNPISIAFRYYELESYEESLSNCEYVLDKDSIIDYRKSRKLIKGLKKAEAINLDMSGYRKDFDILHTMANVLGLKIKRLFLDSKGIECVEFDNGDRVSSDSIDLCKYPKLTNLIWWER